MRTLRLALVVVAVVPGLITALLCGFLMVSDLGRYSSLASSTFAPPPNLGGFGLPGALPSAVSTVANEAHLTLMRIQCFVSGLGVLLGLILCAIGVHGLCVSSVRAERRGAGDV